MKQFIEFSIILLLTLIFIANYSLNAVSPETISYQGKIENDLMDPVPDGFHEMVFSIYDQQADAIYYGWKSEMSKPN